MSEAAEELFDIGAVSRLTGLSTPNLRVWEKRYDLVRPTRTETNRRRYTSEDIRRLTLAKTLSDHGHALGSLAGLSTEELEERLRKEAALGGSDRPAECRATVIGSELVGLLEGREHALDGIRIVGRFDTIARAESDLHERAELLLVATPTLFPETVAAIRSLVAKCGALRAVVAYRFAPADAATRLDKDLNRITAVRFPIDFAELQVISRAEASLIHAAPSGSEPPQRATPEPPELDGDAIPPRRFDESQLARISRLTGTIECECPRHLAELLGILNAFATYSEECENRNEDDAKMHAYLHAMTCRARGLMEQALAELLRFERIELD